MNHSPAFRLLGIASLGALIAVPALAQDTSHAYFGVSVGQSKTEIDANGVTSGLLPGVSAASSSTDEKDTAYKLFGGYQFNRNLAIEGGYFNLGNNSFNAVTSPAGTLAGETKAQGLNLDLVGTLPLTERLSALARIGAHHTWSKSTFSGTGVRAAGGGRTRGDGPGGRLRGTARPAGPRAGGRGAAPPAREPVGRCAVRLGQVHCAP